MDDIMKIIKSLEESGLIIKVVSETIKNEANKQRSGFLVILLGTLGASLLGNLLTGKKVKQSNEPGEGVILAAEDAIRAVEVTIRAGKGTIRAGQDF